MYIQISLARYYFIIFSRFTSLSIKLSLMWIDKYRYILTFRTCVYVCRKMPFHIIESMNITDMRFN